MKRIKTLPVFLTLLMISAMAYTQSVTVVIISPNPSTRNATVLLEYCNGYDVVPIEKEAEFLMAKPDGSVVAALIFDNVDTTTGKMTVTVTTNTNERGFQVFYYYEPSIIFDFRDQIGIIVPNL